MSFYSYNKYKKNLDIIYGIHSARAAICNPKRVCQKILLTQKIRDEFLKSIICLDVKIDVDSLKEKIDILTNQELDKYMCSCGVRDAVHQGVILLAEPLYQKTLQELLFSIRKNGYSRIIILDQVTDPHNIGSICRSCAFFGVDALIMQSRHSPKLTSIILKVAAGGVECVPFIYVSNIAQALHLLQKNLYQVVGFDNREQTSIPLHKYKFSSKEALVFGSEGFGMRKLTKTLCDTTLAIESGYKDIKNTRNTRSVDCVSSINVSNAVAVGLCYSYGT